jgi:hypothetical protein
MPIAIALCSKLLYSAIAFIDIVIRVDELGINHVLIKVGRGSLIFSEYVHALGQRLKNCSSEFFFGRLKAKVNLDFFCHFLVLYDHKTTNC